MNKRVAVWQIILGAIAFFYELSRIISKGQNYTEAGMAFGQAIPIIVLAIFAIITGISNLNKK